MKNPLPDYGMVITSGAAYTGTLSLTRLAKLDFIHVDNGAYSSLVSMIEVKAIQAMHPKTEPTLPAILGRVCGAFEVSPESVTGKGRPSKFVLPRHVFFYLARNLTTHSLHEIGRFCGDRDHTAVIHGIGAVTQHMEQEPAVKAKTMVLLQSFSTDKQP